jgi:hypothetical protein
MRPVTDSFLSAVRGSHKAIFRARVLAPGLVGVNPGPLNADGSPLNEIPILSGDVTFDTTADVNSTLDLTTNIAWPGLPTSLGNPYGSEIYIERGVQYANGIKEYVGLGYFRIDSIEQQNAPKGTLRITGSDRMANIRDGRRAQPIQFSAGASVGAVIDFAVGEVVPGLVTVYDTSLYTTFLVADAIMDQDRLGFVQNLVAAYGKVAYFDYAGRLQIKSAPSPTSQPVYTINSGTNGVLVSMDRAISRDGVYNAVVVTGEAAGQLPPVMATAYDTNPASPTRWGGPFGYIPEFYSSSFLTTSAQCLSAGNAMLTNATGVPYSVSLGTVPNPALEGWDVINVSYVLSADSETHIIDKISYGLSVSGPMGVDTRKQYITS